MFTTSCFIRKSSPELIDKLVELGYTLSEFSIDSCNCIATTSNLGVYIKISEEMFDTPNPHRSWKADRIDCGQNEELFLGLASLRDDSDQHQWFTDGEVWRKEGDSGWHKATPQELIKHFI